MWLQTRHVHWYVSVIPAAAVGLYEAVRHAIGSPDTPAGNLAGAILVLTICAAINWFLFRQLEGTNAERERRRRESEALYRVGTEITSLQHPDQVLQTVATKTRELLGADFATIGLQTAVGEFQTRAVSGMTMEELEQMRCRMGRELLVDEVMKTGTPRAELLPSGAYGGVKCRLATPLTLGEQAIGALCVGSTSRKSFTSEDMALIQRFANQAAIAIHNANLHRQVEQVAMLEERDRIARELHDGLGQTMSFMAMTLEQAEDALTEGRTDSAQGRIRRAIDAARAASVDIRESILGLRMLSREGSWPDAMQAFLRQFGELNHIAAGFTLPPEPLPPIPFEAEVQLIRILQEAVANVRKHAQAKRVEVEVKVSGEALCVTVHDDGAGFDPAQTARQPGAHFGLMIMQERAASVGGSLTVESQPGEGTHVQVCMPLSRR